MTGIVSPARRLLAASFVSQVGNWLTFTGLAQSTVAWVFGGDVGAYAGFFGAGLTYGLVNGVLRGLLDSSARAGGVDPVPLWAWANQVVVGANLAIYAAAAVAFAVGMAPVAGALVLIVGCAAFVAQSARTVSAASRRAQSPNPVAGRPSTSDTPSDT